MNIETLFKVFEWMESEKKDYSSFHEVLSFMMKYDIIKPFLICENTCYQVITKFGEVMNTSNLSVIHSTAVKMKEKIYENEF